MAPNSHNKTKENQISHTQDHDLSHSMAHYLLTIHKLKEFKGYARVTDIAKDLGLTKGSVSTALNNLKKRGLVAEEEDSKFLSLSNAGHDVVHNILTTRTLLFYFLKDFLKVSDENAHQDSCLMEHLMCDETREKLFEFMQSLSSKDDDHRADTCRNLSLGSTLNFGKYETYDEFLKDQKGDSYLQG